MKSDRDPWLMKYLLPALFTLIVGIVSFLLSQLYLRHLDKKRSKDKYIGILKVLSEEVKRNLDLECQLHAYLYVRLLPTFGLSFFITEKIFAELTTVCLNYDLLKKIFHKYFEYRHIQNRLDKILTSYKELEETKKVRDDSFNSIFAATKYSSEINGTILLIQGNIKGSYELYNEIIREIHFYDDKAQVKELPSTYLQIKYDEFQNDSAVKSSAKRIDLDYLDKREKFF
ncbi:hypothetical protein [Rosettibacter firmus]|uniref:hypothetical protein n=1 Tax=Rosettibacter firmus TaxID=3111522 RepID=UPI00336BCDF0